MSPKLKAAIELAQYVHKGQVDKQGVDYIKHPEMVASFVDSEDAKIVAYLHDTIEDGDGKITIEQIKEMFGEKVAHAVFLLTRPKDMPYFDYVRRIKDCELAKQVKLADLKHNTMPERGTIPDTLMRRYEKAKRILTE